MLLAEVKVRDDAEWEVRLFNMTLAQFQKVSNQRFTAIRRTKEVSTEEIIEVLIKYFKW